MSLADTYRRLRREHPRYGARTCLALARQSERFAGFWGYYGNAEHTAEWSDGGYTFTATLRDDPDADLSWLGEWTDDPDGAIPNREWFRGSHVYRYFRPENPGAGEVPYFRAAGYGRHEAWLAGVELDRAAAEMARSPETYTVDVTAFYNGRPVGEASLGGVDDSYPYTYAASVAREELGPEAAHEADRTLARMLHTAPEMVA